MHYKNIYAIHQTNRLISTENMCPFHMYFILFHDRINSLYGPKWGHQKAIGLNGLLLYIWKRYGGLHAWRPLSKLSQGRTEAKPLTALTLYTLTCILWAMYVRMYVLMREFTFVSVGPSVYMCDEERQRGEVGKFCFWWLSCWHIYSSIFAMLIV